jgi:hypothetical protein
VSRFHASGFFSVVEQLLSYSAWSDLGMSPHPTLLQHPPSDHQYVKRQAFLFSSHAKPSLPSMLFSQYGTGSALDVLALAAAHHPADDSPPLRIPELNHSCSGSSGGCRVPNSDLYPRSPGYYRTSYIGLENSTRGLHISDGGSYFEKESVILPRVCRSTDRNWQTNSSYSGEASPTSPCAQSEGRVDKVR